MSHDTQVKREAPPDISSNDSERLQGFVRMTSVEIRAVGSVGAATSLEMIGYIRELEQSRATVRREVFKEAATLCRAQESPEYDIEVMASGWEDCKLHCAEILEASASEKGEMNG